MNRPIVALPEPADQANQNNQASQAVPVAEPAPNPPTTGIMSPTPTSAAMVDGPAAGAAAAPAVPVATAAPVAATPVDYQPAPAAMAVAAPAPPAPPASPTGAGSPHPSGALPRTRGFRIGLAQIICWQLAVVAVAVAVGARIGPVGTAGTSVAALSLVAVTAIRIRGTWLHQWAVIGLRFLHRQRQADLAGAPNAAVALLEPWLGATKVDVVAVREKPLALLSHRSAVSALLRLEPAAGARDALAGVLGALDEHPVEVEVQLLLHANGHQDHDLRAWIAIAARRSVDLSTDEQLAMVVKNAVRRVQRHLERAGSQADPVDDHEAATTIVELSHAGAGHGHVRERWPTWSAGPVSQVCLRLTGYTDLEPNTADALVDTLLGTSAGAAVTVSLGSRIAARTGAVVRHDPVVRIAAASQGGLDVAVTVLTRLAAAYRVHPERLDGRHGPGMAASLPIARTQV